MKRYAIHQCAIYRAKGFADPCEALHITRSHLERLSREGSSAYREWDEHKANGSLRHIEAPRGDLKRLQKRLALLLMRVQPPDFLYCPVKSRDFILNARKHIGAKVIWTIDIKAYFESTPVGRIKQFYLHRLRCASDLAAVLTSVSSINGHLPTGSPLSPILAYFANEPMWRAIEQLVDAAGCKMSVYMDDLTVSGGQITHELRQQIKQVLGRFGFKGHKERRYTGRAAKITGNYVTTNKVSLPHDFYQRRRIKRAVLRTAPQADLSKLERSVKGMDQLHILAARRSNVQGKQT